MFRAQAEVAALSVSSKVFVVVSCDMCSFVFTRWVQIKVVEVSMGKCVLKSKGVVGSIITNNAGMGAFQGSDSAPLKSPCRTFWRQMRRCSAFTKAADQTRLARMIYRSRKSYKSVSSILIERESEG